MKYCWLKPAVENTRLRVLLLFTEGLECLSAVTEQERRDKSCAFYFVVAPVAPCTNTAVFTDVPQEPPI